MSVHLCSFSGSVAYLSRKQKQNPMQVLQVLANDPRVSTFDMDEHNLWQTIYALVEKGLLKDETEKEVYPWCCFAVTKAGRKAIAAEQSVHLTAGWRRQNRTGEHARRK